MKSPRSTAAPGRVAVRAAVRVRFWFWLGFSAGGSGSVVVGIGGEDEGVAGALDGIGEGDVADVAFHPHDDFGAVEVDDRFLDAGQRRERVFDARGANVAAHTRDAEAPGDDG
jgi:hypothetical protein